jgi:hypothetical protein
LVDTKQARQDYSYLWQGIKKPALKPDCIQSLLDEHVSFWKRELLTTQTEVSSSQNGANTNRKMLSSPRRSKKKYTKFYKQIEHDCAEMRPNDSSNNGKQRKKIRNKLKSKHLMDVELLMAYLDCYGSLTYGSAGGSRTEEKMRRRIVWLRGNIDHLDLTVPAGDDYKLNLFIKVITSHVEHVYHYSRNVAKGVFNAVRSFPWFDGLEALAGWVGFLNDKERVKAASELIKAWKKSSSGGYFSLFCNRVNGTRRMKNALSELSTIIKDIGKSKWIVELRNDINNLDSPVAVYQFASFIACGLISNMDRHPYKLDKLNPKICLALALIHAYKEYKEEICVDLDAIVDSEADKVPENDHQAEQASCYSKHKSLVWGSGVAAVGVAITAAMHYLPQLMGEDNDTSMVP